MKLADYTDADLADARHALINFEGSLLDRLIQDHIGRTIARLLDTLALKSTPLEDVRYAQGELAQAKRDIMIREGLQAAVDREISMRQKRTQ